MLDRSYGDGRDGEDNDDGDGSVRWVGDLDIMVKDEAPDDGRSSRAMTMSVSRGELRNKCRASSTSMPRNRLPLTLTISSPTCNLPSLSSHPAKEKNTQKCHYYWNKTFFNLSVWRVDCTTIGHTHRRTKERKKKNSIRGSFFFKFFYLTLWLTRRSGRTLLYNFP